MSATRATAMTTTPPPQVTPACRVHNTSDDNSSSGGGEHASTTTTTTSSQLLSYVPQSLLLYLQSAPAPIIFAAFQADCAARGLPWYSTRAQKLAVALFVNFAISRRYPPRYSTLRSLLKQYITRIEQPHIMQEVLRTQGDGSDGAPCDDSNGDGGGGDDPVLLELMEAYIHLSVMEGDKDHSLCYKTFYNPYLLDEDAHHSNSSNSNSSASDDATHGGRGSSHGAIVAAAKAALAIVAGDADADELRRHSAEAMVRKLFCTVRVASRQYSNVGLSVWPAAFVLVQLLAQELRGTTHLLTSVLFPRHGGSHSSSSNVTMNDYDASGTSLASLREHEKLHLLELGAGVGLTPVLLHRLPAYQRCVSTFVLSDYQTQLTENIQHNLHMNHVTVVDDLHAAAMGLEGDKQRPFHAVVPLAWGHTAEVESLLVDWGCDVVLAADCVYDVDAIPALVSCIHLALTLPLTHGGMEWSRSLKSRSVAADDARQQHHARYPAGYGGGNSNSSSTTSASTAAAAGAASPPRKPVCVVVQTHRQNSTMKVFFDAVREFAHVRSYRLVRGTRAELLPRLSARLDGVDGGFVPLGEWHSSSSAASCDDATVLCALQPDQVLEDGSMLHEHAARLAASGGYDGDLHSTSSSLGDLRTTLASLDIRSASMTTTSNTHTAAVLAAAAATHDDVVDVDTLLRDEMIGPFYVPMAGLIGVHILQSK